MPRKPRRGREGGRDGGWEESRCYAGVLPVCNSACESPTVSMREKLFCEPRPGVVCAFLRAPVDLVDRGQSPRSPPVVSKEGIKFLEM